MDDGPVRNAVAFAPSHVTGLFAPALESRDPRGRGSTGAGIVLEAGVRAIGRIAPANRARLNLRNDIAHSLPISGDAARRLLAARPYRLEIRLSHSLPIGQGFGSSAAGALASALVTARLIGRPRRDAIEVAHLADLFGRGGLGGVAAILDGGLEVRELPGIPPYGRISHRPITASILVGAVGRPLPSPSILRQPRLLERIQRAADGIDRVRSNPTVEELFRQSEAFTDRVGLAPPEVRTAIRALRRRGAWVAQAMFGASFFALPRSRAARREVVKWLIDHGVRAIELGASRQGARIERGPRRAFSA